MFGVSFWGYPFFVAKATHFDCRLIAKGEFSRGEIIFESLNIRAGCVKQCPGCGNRLSINDILNDPDVRPIGMHTESNNHKLHGMVFQHDSPYCQSSFQIDLESLAPLVSTSGRVEMCNIPTECDRRCLTAYQDDPCPLNCSFTPYHELMLKMLRSREVADTHCVTRYGVAVIG